MRRRHLGAGAVARARRRAAAPALQRPQRRRRSCCAAKALSSASLQHDAWLGNTRRCGGCARSCCFARRTLKRLDLTSRTLVALVEPGSCFAGFSPRCCSPRTAATCSTARSATTPVPPRSRFRPPNFGDLPMCNGLSRLATRFYGDPSAVRAFARSLARRLERGRARAAGLVTFTPDEIDWRRRNPRCCWKSARVFRPTR